MKKYYLKGILKQGESSPAEKCARKLLIVAGITLYKCFYPVPTNTIQEDFPRAIKEKILQVRKTYVFHSSSHLYFSGRYAPWDCSAACA